MKRIMEIVRGGGATPSCTAVSPWLADHVRGQLAGGRAADVEEHLGRCAECRATRAALALVLGTAGGERPDLWPRLAKRLATEAAPDRLRLPAFDWRAAVAAILVLTLPWFAPGARYLTTLMIFGA
jgi:anti-sigma factor RsiW